MTMPIASMRAVQLLVIAKAPMPGRVKTRLCPPYTPVEAARLAAAALADTVDVVRSAEVSRRVLVLDGELATPEGFEVVAQHGNGLADRLANAFVDTYVPGVASVLVGMDTPQLTLPELEASVRPLLHGTADAVLGPAHDGGWWLLGLADPRIAGVLRGVPMSTAETGARTREALIVTGLRVQQTVTMRDVDTVSDAYAVAAAAAGRRFAATVRALGDRDRELAS